MGSAPFRIVRARARCAAFGGARRGACRWGIGFPLLPLMARAATGTRVCVSQSSQTGHRTRLVSRFWHFDLLFCVSQSSHNGHQACRVSWFRLVHHPRCERMVTRRGPHREVRPRRQSEDCHAAYTAKHVNRWARRRYGRLRGGWRLLRIPRYAEGTRCVRLLTEAQSMPAIRLVECVGHVDNR